MSQPDPQTFDYHPRRKPRKDRRTPWFWRATRYLRPYRKLVIVSIIAAFFAGGVFASGLGAVLPILQTLLHGDTPQMWVDRMIAEQRWGIDLADDPNEVRVTAVDPTGPLGFPFTSNPFVGEAPKSAELARMANDSLSLSGEGAEASEQLSALAIRRDAFATPHFYPPPFPKPTPWYLDLLRDVMYLLPSNPVAVVAVLMGFILLLTILANIVRFFQEYLSGKAALNAVNDVRRDLYDHALRVPMSYFGKSGTGDVTSRIVHDSAQLQQGFTTLLGPAVQQPIMAFFAFLVALLVDWRLTLFIIAFAPVMGVVLQKFGKKMRRASRSALQNNAELLGQIEATLGGIRVVKANVAEAHESNRLRRILDNLLRYQLKLQKYDAASSPVMETFAVAAAGIIVVVMVYFVRAQGTLSVPGALLIFGCLAQMADSLRRLSKLNALLQKSNAAAERIFETIDLPSESHQRDTEAQSQGEVQPDLPLLQREIAFEHVTFRYDSEMPAALKAVSLTVNKGESVAVVGRNGSGKTTLLSLLPRFFDPDEGRIAIDGRDIREFSLESLRRQIGVVTQEAVVFPGTIAENIAYARPDAPREEIEAAARQAEAHDFITTKPLGYDTPLTGLGGQLSGGQRQRLNIARAILRDPPILILDEATSQVDAESEHLIQQAISRLMQGRTVFVIAHRFSTILDCDRIALMEAGRLVAVGRHDELLDTSDLYRTLYDRQLVGA